MKKVVILHSVTYETINLKSTFALEIANLGPEATELPLL